MIKVKEFYDMRDYSKKKWLSAYEQVNEFIVKNKVELIDVKYNVVIYDNGDAVSYILLIYKEKGE